MRTLETREAKAGSRGRLLPLAAGGILYLPSHEHAPC